jgi:hypothetical protein
MYYAEGMLRLVNQRMIGVSVDVKCPNVIACVEFLELNNPCECTKCMATELV